MDYDQFALNLINAWEEREYLHSAQKKAALQVAIRDALSVQSAPAGWRELRDRLQHELVDQHMRQSCCGHGVDCGDHEECCGEPTYVWLSEDAVPVITAVGKFFDALSSAPPPPVSERVAKLEEALRFYANRYSWRSSTVYMCGHSGKSRAEMDAGEKARAALAGGSHDK